MKMMDLVALQDELREKLPRTMDREEVITLVITTLDEYQAALDKVADMLGSVTSMMSALNTKVIVQGVKLEMLSRKLSNGEGRP